MVSEQLPHELNNQAAGLWLKCDRRSLCHPFSTHHMCGFCTDYSYCPFSLYFSLTGMTNLPKIVCFLSCMSQFNSSLVMTLATFCIFPWTTKNELASNWNLRRYIRVQRVVSEWNITPTVKCPKMLSLK